MHGLVFEYRVRGLAANEPRYRRVFDGCALQRALEARVAEGCERRNGAPIGPIGPVVAVGLGKTTGIDAALEKPLQRGIDWTPAQSALVQGQKTERRNVAFVKRERMPQRDRAVVKDAIVDQGKEPRRVLAVAPIPLEKSRAVEGDCGSYSVPRFSCSRSMETKSALKLPLPNDRLPLR